jgi:hypothetical protein
MPKQVFLCFCCKTTLTNYSQSKITSFTLHVNEYMCVVFFLVEREGKHVCPVGSFACGDDPTCVPQQQQCDNVTHCPNGFDEAIETCRMYTLAILSILNESPFNIPRQFPPDLIEWPFLTSLLICLLLDTKTNIFTSLHPPIIHSPLWQTTSSYFFYFIFQKSTVSRKSPMYYCCCLIPKHLQFWT